MLRILAVHIINGWYLIPIAILIVAPFVAEADARYVIETAERATHRTARVIGRASVPGRHRDYRHDSLVA